MDRADLAAEVVARYEEQLSLYRSLLAVAGKIAEHLRAGGGEEQLASFLAEQGRLTEAIDRAEQAIAPMRRKLAEAHGHPDLTLGLLSTLDEPPAPLQQAGAVMRRVAAVLQDLQAAFAENGKLMEERLGAVRSQQASLSRAKCAVQAYRRTSPDDPRFLDRRS